MRKSEESTSLVEVSAKLKAKIEAAAKHVNRVFVVRGPEDNEAFEQADVATKIVAATQQVFFAEFLGDLLDFVTSTRFRLLQRAIEGLSSISTEMPESGDE